MQALTIKLRIFPENHHCLRQLSQEYIRVVNSLTEQAEKDGAFPRVTTKDVDANLPSAVLNQAIRDAKRVAKKIKTSYTQKNVYFVNNQNFTIVKNEVAFPIMIDGKAKKTIFKSILTERDKELLKSAKLGLMRVVEKAGKWFAQVSLAISVDESNCKNIMGVDLGLFLR